MRYAESGALPRASGASDNASRATRRIVAGWHMHDLIPGRVFTIHYSRKEEWDRVLIINDILIGTPPRRMLSA